MIGWSRKALQNNLLVGEDVQWREVGVKMSGR